MSDVTIKQLAQVLGMPVDKLIDQLDGAGMKFFNPEQVVSISEKARLLGFLRRTHGRGEDITAVTEDSSPHQVTLRRRKISEIKVNPSTGKRGSSGSHKTTAKIVNVEVRSKRTYVRRSVIHEHADHASEREEAAFRLIESQQQHEQKENAFIQAQEAARQRKANQAMASSAQIQATGFESANNMVDTSSVVAPPDETVTVEPEKNPDFRCSSEPFAMSTPSITDHSAFGLIVPQIHEPRKRENKATTKTATKAPQDKTTATDSDRDSGRNSKSRPGRTRDSAASGKHFVSGELHLSAVDRARRSGRRGKSGRGTVRDTSRPVAAPAVHSFTRPTATVVHEVMVSEVNLVAELAQKMAIKGSEVVKALFKMGVMATINQTIDHDTAVLVIEALGHTPVEKSSNDAESMLAAHARHVRQEGKKSARPPVVTIMGHVDHGKTSLLDYIRRTRVASGEVGGITQHIGAYHVDTPKGVITFLDTPGHAAFTAMRARGAQATDIVVLVVAADDGVMPQTAEAVKHARAARVPLIVALNKMDKDDANPDHVKQGLVNLEVIPEDWGGDTMFVPLSAKTGMGMDDLLDAISIQAEVMELTASVDGSASGVVIESSLDRGRGPRATLLVQQGLLKRGDFLVCGIEYGRMRALIDENGKTVNEAGPSIPVRVQGLSGVLESGDDFVVVADEKLARQVADERHHKRRETRLVKKINRFEDIMVQMNHGNAQQTLNILVKADVQGSVEALRESLNVIGNDQVKVQVVSCGVGGITESDATLAASSRALVIGFNVRADAAARRVIDTMGLDVRYFSVIYDVIDQVKQAASGLLGLEIREQIIGIAEVREVFRSSRFGSVAGCMVTEGRVQRSKPIRVLRDNTVIFEGELESLRRFKELVDEVRNSMECGIAVKQYNDVRVGDQIECFERTEVARTLV